MKYYVNRNAQVGGEHEVHTSTCDHLPNPDNRVYLGEHSSCQEAVIQAAREFREVNGCYYCCLACHRR